MSLIVENDFQDRYSFSLVQEDIFYDQLHHNGSPKYNIGGYVRLGSIDENKLKQAHALVVQNNRMFSMRLGNKADGVFVFLSSEINTELPVVDLSMMVDPERSASNWLSEAFSHPFDLYGDSLFRVALLKLSSDLYFYVAITHHLLIDGWGIANWARQLGNYYSDSKQEIESESEFAAYFTQDFIYLQSSRYLDDQAFWRAYLKAPVKLFPPQHVRVFTAKSERSKRLCFDIDKNLSDQIANSSEFFKKNEHSLFIALVALYFGRIAQLNSITVGVPAHNRRGYANKKLIGLYTSVSPLQIELSDSLSFMALVELIKAEQVKVFRHQKYPIGHMVRDLGAAARAGLFDIGVNYLKLENKFVYGDSLAQIRYVENDYQTTPFNLTIWDNGDNQPSQLQVDFCLEYFNDSDIRLIGNRILYLLKQVAINPVIPIGELDVTDPVELSLIKPELSAVMKPTVPFIQLFEEQALQQPGSVALSYLQQTFTYQQLNQLAKLLSLKLAAQGVNAGCVVGLLAGRRPEIIVAILALHKLGAVYLPLDPSYPISRLHFMLKDSGCKVLLTTSDLLGLSADFTVEKLMLDSCMTPEAIEQSSAESQLSYGGTAKSDQLAYIIYTSGSTGQPKGVMISQLALSNFLQSMMHEPGFTANDWLLAVTPFGFDISILELLLPLVSGGTVRLFHTALIQDVSGLISDLQEYPITMLQMTPSAWKILLASEWHNAPHLKALTGGEALPAYLAEVITPKVKQLWNMYGPTETTIWSSCTQIRLPMEFNSIGKPIANTQMLVLDSKNRLLPVGVFGMLYIGGAGLAEGYWERPALTDERFITLFGARWYQTGDIARLLSNGEFEFQGRDDHQVKLNGYRIELGEIESLLSRYQDVTDCAVLIKTLANGRRVLCAYYQSSQGITEALLRAFLAEELPIFMVPSVYINVPTFPRTPSGKTDLNALPEPELVSAQEQVLRAETYDPLTTKLLTLIKSHLNISRLEPTDNFFDVGASSVDVMNMSINISRELGQALSVIDMFSHPSVEALTIYLQGSLPEHQSAQKARRHEAAQRGKSRLNDRLAARKLLDEV